MYPLVISKITKNTRKSVLISFEVPEAEKERFRFEAGQYLTLETKINEKLVRRSYSICSGIEEGLQVGIKEVPEGTFSTFANRSLHEDDVMMVAPPEGRFQYLSCSKAQTLVGFAAGSGITPVMSIIKTALSDHPENSFYLVYGNKTYNLSIKTLQFVGKMLSGNMGTDNLSGPIGIAQMAGNTAQAGFLPFMYLMALLSISLAVLNLLPIPVLDGGQLTLLGIEAIRGKPLPEKAENMIYTGGAAIVVMLMIFAVFNDISRFF